MRERNMPNGVPWTKKGKSALLHVWRVFAGHSSEPYMNPHPITTRKQNNPSPSTNAQGVKILL